jgi:gamma-glutamylcyclotransferase (GGCT)/AIG2-like uncharacterized protein YtfP
MTEKFFVYGTLCPGRPNAHILENISGSFEQGEVKGHLYEKGWGAEIGYPGIVLDSNGESVSGYVFTSEHLSVHWQSLDEFEGDAYERVIANVEPSNGGSVDALVYGIKE